jgi:hypothetical protein
LADLYIDLQERPIYGSMATKRLTKYAERIGEDEAAEVDAQTKADLAMQRAVFAWLAREIDERTAYFAEALETANGARADVHDLSAAKLPLKAQAKKALGGLKSHLDDLIKQGATIDLKRFYTGGRVRDVGDGATAVLGAVGKAIAGCRHYEGALPTLAQRRAQLEALLPQLSMTIEDSANAHGEAAGSAPEVRAASAAWDTTYGAAKKIALGMLELRGDATRLKWLFHDLAVAPGTKLRNEPETGDVTPPAPAAGPAR